MQRIRIKYSKELKFIGHLDIVRLWERAIRRADIPIAYTEGFNPRQKLSFGPPLSLGLTSECELIDLYMERWSNHSDIAQQLREALPPGINILESGNIFSGLAAITAAVTAAEYTADFERDIESRIDEILSSKEIFAPRKEKNINPASDKRGGVNIRPMIKGIKINDKKIKITAQCDSRGALKGSEMISLFPGNNIENIRRTLLF